MIKNIGIFCGSSIGSRAVYREKAAELAYAMARRELDLVFGGGNIGLMRVAADAMMSRGRKAVGVMPRFLAKKEIAHQGISEMIFTETMEERKQKIIALSDAFIAMPGGFGTLDEISDVLTGFQLNIIDKPLALFNVEGYFDELLRFLDTMAAEGFLRPEHRNNIISEADPEKLLQELLHFQPETVPHKWVDKLREDTDAAVGY